MCFKFALNEEKLENLETFHLMKIACYCQEQQHSWRDEVLRYVVVSDLPLSSMRTNSKRMVRTRVKQQLPLE